MLLPALGYHQIVGGRGNFKNGSSLLALGAVVAAAAGDDDAFNGSFADEAGFSFATVDAMFELEEAFLAV